MRAASPSPRAATHSRWTFAAPRSCLARCSTTKTAPTVSTSSRRLRASTSLPSASLACYWPTARGPSGCSRPSRRHRTASCAAMHSLGRERERRRSSRCSSWTRSVWRMDLACTSTRHTRKHARTARHAHSRHGITDTRATTQTVHTTHTTGHAHTTHTTRTPCTPYAHHAHHIHTTHTTHAHHEHLLCRLRLGACDTCLMARTDSTARTTRTRTEIPLRTSHCVRRKLLAQPACVLVRPRVRLCARACRPTRAPGGLGRVGDAGATRGVGRRRGWQR